MEFKNIDQLLEKVRERREVKRLAIAAAADPILIGDKPLMEQILKELQEEIPPSNLIDEPDVDRAALTALEKVNPQVQETLDAAALKRMNQEGAIADCVVEGPISIDLALDPKAAAIKGYESPVVGKSDIFVVPNIACGNIFNKGLRYLAGSRQVGVVLGRKRPLSSHPGVRAPAPNTCPSRSPAPWPNSRTGDHGKRMTLSHPSRQRRSARMG